MKKPHLVADLTTIHFKKSDLLHNTLAFAHYLRALENIVKQYLPDTFQSRCQVSAFNYGELTLCCDNAAWSIKLRFHLAQLKNHLERHGEFSGLSKIIIKTEVCKVYRSNKKLPKAKLLSLENKDLLLQTAACETDTQLAQALKRLAAHASTANGTSI